MHVGVNAAACSDFLLFPLFLSITLKMKRVLLCTFLILNWCAGLGPAVAGPITGLVVFGDSLSDAGNVQQRTTALVPLVQPTPGPYYFDGRFSNGPNYADVLSQGLGLGPLARSLAGGDNFAYGGARTSGTPFPNSLVVQDVDDQVSLFLAARTPAAGELFVVFAGADDLLDLLAANGTNVVPSVNSLRTSMTRLYDAGAREFLVMNVPELGATPRYNGDPVQAAAANALTVQFNAALAMSLDALEATEPGLTIHRFDVAGLFNDLLADPAAFGLANVIDPAAPGLEPGDQSYNTGLIAPNVNQYLFWDTLHPTAAAHALLGQQALAIVPEPAGLVLLGFGGLWLISGRRKSRHSNRHRQGGKQTPCRDRLGLTMKKPPIV